MATILFVLGAGPAETVAQQIRYSTPMGDNIRSTNFDIVGFCGDHLLIYKESYNHYKMAVYDPGLKILDEVPLDFLPPELTHEDFIRLPDRAIMIYQYTRRRDLYCAFATIDASGNPVGKPRLIDRTVHPERVVGSNPYTVLRSADRSKVMVVEFLRNEDSMVYHLKTFLFDTSMALLSAGGVEMPYRQLSDRLDAFALSDSGGLYFTFGARDELYEDYFQDLALCYKPPREDRLLQTSVPFGETPLKTAPVLKIADEAGQIWLAAFAGDARSHNVDDLYFFRCRSGDLAAVDSLRVPLTDSLKKAMRSKTEGPRQAFNDYRLQDLVLDRRGHALAIAEERYTGQEGAPHYDHLALLEINADGSLTGVGKVEKEQGSDLGPPFVSYLLVNTGASLHFLVNKSHRVFRFLNNYVYLLTDYLYSADHRLRELPVLRGLDSKMQWAVRYGMQVNRNQVVIPCVSGSSLLFGMITYPEDGAGIKSR